MILGKLGIRGKLNLLLLLPLIAVLVVATPFVLNQAGNASAAGTTAGVAGNARSLGSLIWELQRERLLTAGFLASPSLDSDNLERQQRIVDEAVKTVRTTFGSTVPDEIDQSLTRIGSLSELRQNALARGASLDSVARTYHAVIEAIIDALRLVPQKTSDAEGTRQLTALEALLRANEESALRGMALIVATVNSQTGQPLLDDSSNQAQQLIERFVQQADQDQAITVVQVEQGVEAKRVDSLVTQLPDRQNVGAIEPFIAEAQAGIEAQSDLRRAAQDKVTGQIADAAAARASDASRVAWTVGIGALLLFLLVAALAVFVSRSIANPLRRLTAAAGNVADLADSELVRVSDTEEANEQVPRLTAIDVASSDELGKLAAAFNRVQHTAASLVERQAVTRRNVSMMFANVAQRTQNLVGRQLALVDELERNEQDERLLASLYKLDHLSTRLRRNADNLLVVAGAQDDTKIAGPSELSVALRSALAEIEDYQRVRLGDLSEIMLQPQVGIDLVLVFAELLENATSFSPPDTFVEVESGYLPDGSCLVNVIDHGIGMPDDRLAEENRRIVERERLDIAPTSMLGLFVVGRLGRRHGLMVDLVPSPGSGLTARVVIPAALFTRLNMPEPMLEEFAPVQTPEPAAAVTEPGTVTWQRLPVPVVPNMAIPPAAFTEGFTWFTPMTPARRSLEHNRPAHSKPVPAPVLPSPPPVPVPAAPLTPMPAASPLVSENGRTGLRRRVAGAQLPGAAPVEPPTQPSAKPAHDPAAARAAFDGFQSGIARAAEQPPVEPPMIPPPYQNQGPAAPPPSAPQANLGPSDPGRNGLRRRVAGAQLPGAVPQAQPASPPPPTVSRPARHDPTATRSAMDGFQSAFAKAANVPPADPPPAATPPAARGGGGRHGGLSRRVPGESLAPGLRRQASELRKQAPGSLPARAAGGWHARNPEAERSAFDAFASGLARAGSDADTPSDPLASAAWPPRGGGNDGTRPRDATGRRDPDPTKESKG